MHLQKPAVVTFRTTYALKDYLEQLALHAGLSFSDFLRMAVLLGAKNQAELLGIRGVEVPVLADPNKPKPPAYKKGKYEQWWEAQERYPLSDGTIPDNLDELLERRLERIRQLPSIRRSRGLTQK